MEVKAQVQTRCLRQCGSIVSGLDFGIFFPLQTFYMHKNRKAKTPKAWQDLFKCLRNPEKKIQMGFKTSYITADNCQKHQKKEDFCKVTTMTV